MKYVKNNRLYIQKNDILMLLDCETSIHKSFFDKLFNSEELVINDENRFDFMEFSDYETVNLLKKCDWIIDYDEVIKLSIDQLIDLIVKISLEKNEIVIKYNIMSDNEKIYNHNLLEQIKLYDYKISTLNNLLLNKKNDNSKIKIKK